LEPLEFALRDSNAVAITTGADRIETVDVSLESIGYHESEASVRRRVLFDAVCDA
jgi:hypothetical protein